ncbi:methyltransferase domain-containing protein, partial [Jeotgalicoccus huakuii]|nr:methyltransferase domain-containing protein [Jeotgalicoccus huakuii]
KGSRHVDQAKRLIAYANQPDTQVRYVQQIPYGPTNTQAAAKLDPALASRDGLYDFVFCRNLLIYFDVPTQQRVFEVLKRLLHPQGVLFIGPAEGSLLARLG